MTHLLISNVPNAIIGDLTYNQFCLDRRSGTGCSADHAQKKEEREISSVHAGTKGHGKGGRL
jgi:hypothetical protein